MTNLSESLPVACFILVSELSATTEGANVRYKETIFCTIVAAAHLYCTLFLIHNPSRIPRSLSPSSQWASCSLSLTFLSRVEGGERKRVQLELWSARYARQKCVSAPRSVSLHSDAKIMQPAWGYGSSEGKVASRFEEDWGGEEDWSVAERERNRERGDKTERPPFLLTSLNRAKTEGFGVFNFFFRFIFFLFLIAVLGGASSFHIVSLSVICLLIYFSIYVVYNFLYPWMWERRGEFWFDFCPFPCPSSLFPHVLPPNHHPCHFLSFYL